MLYTCVTKCYWREQLWEPGETVEVHGDEDIPDHFQPDDPGDAEKAEGMTKAQIIEALKAKCVEFPSNANKADLQAILEANS